MRGEIFPMALVRRIFAQPVSTSPYADVPAPITADMAYCARCNGRECWDEINPAPLGYCARHFEEWMHE